MTIKDIPAKAPTLEQLYDQDPITLHDYKLDYDEVGWWITQHRDLVKDMLNESEEKRQLIDSLYVEGIK